MNRIDACFTSLRQRNEKAFITYLMAGDPNLKATRDLVLSLEKGGADIVELGIPFSDPLADGPVIQAASQRALEAGTTPQGVLDLVAEIRRDSEIPIALMTYYNPVFRYGVERFIADAARAGVNGLLVPDLPLEESDELDGLAAEAGLTFVQFLAPTSTQERIRAAALRARGFIYCVSLTGVTGKRDRLSPRAEALLRDIRQYTSIPLALGFGISGPEQAATAALYADGVIVGSALVEHLSHAGNLEAALAEAENFARGIKTCLLPDGLADTACRDAKA